jgi:L-arabinose isomerase
MIELGQYEVWFITGSQHLYGEQALQQVADDAEKIVAGLNASSRIPVTLVCKPVLTTSDAIRNLCREANASQKCVGLIAWMHTFSPAQMWIAGLQELNKPFLHLHTQFNKEIPWDSIDMDFMNLNQSAHGGREFGFIGTRMGRNRKVVVGHWEDENVQQRLSIWTRAACAWQDSHQGRVARFGDNMRNVAVTEGDKVEARIKLGYAVDGYGVGDLVACVDAVTDAEVEKTLADYEARYTMMDSLRKGGDKRAGLVETAKIECGMRAFLEQGGFTAFTTTFENLHGLAQLPGLAVQRLMEEGYGFGAEGDWKTAALVRAMKVMNAGLEGGVSFMEDYTYHFDGAQSKVLGAHMLEVCGSIAQGSPSLEIHPLGIGGKDDPPRLVFNVPAGAAINASLIDLGHRLRMIVNPVQVVTPDADLPNLPVARALWIPKPELETAASAWILAGGAHHTGFAQALSDEYIEDFCEMADIEHVVIDENTSLREFKNELRWNEAAYRLRSV